LLVIPVKDVDVKGTLLQPQERCYALIIEDHIVGIIRPGNIKVYTETIE